MKSFIQRLLRLFLLTIFACYFSQTFTVSSYAQELNQVKQDSSKQNEELNLDKKQTDVKILLDKIEILGYIEKPQTVFIIQGRDPTVDGIHIDRSFFKQIFRSIEKDNIRKLSEKKKR